MTHICEICKKSFPVIKELKQHLKQTHKRGLYKCKYCDFTSNEKRNLKRHVERKHTDNYAYTCPGCNKKFKTQEYLDNHIINIHCREVSDSSKSYRCDTCDISFASMQESKRHFSDIHKQIMFECDYCKEIFTRKCNLKDHIARIHVDYIYACTETGCDKKFRTLRDRDKHIRDVHHKNQEEKESGSPQPGPSWKSDTPKSGKHSKKSSKKNVRAPYSCNICKKGFNKTEELKHHLSADHGQDMLCCETCGFTCKDKKSLDEHIIRKHTHEHKYMCDEEGCGKKFKLKSDLTKHKRQNHSNEPYTCKKCGHVSSSFSEYRAHNFMHLKRKVACQICGKEIFKHKLHIHLKIHGEKTFACSICGKKFHRGTHLQRHMLTHSQQRPYACNICSAVFVERQALDTHRRDEHPDASPIE
ncbi:zinc finger protein 624-like [Harpegnathos saltator]|uniref:zinc finger protein 624-like n=1 Tax=Harpegnathos saltator TaxID=610380 RepID=UPI000DBED5A0|nr:zinc finger protein 624-like [Harpegnathos saltator]